MLGRGQHRRLGPVLRSRRTAATAFGLLLRLGFPHPRDRGFEFLDVDLEMFDLGLEFSNPLKRRLEFLRGRFPALCSTPLTLFLGALVGLGRGALW
jgi:hypothetical protein